MSSARLDVEVALTDHLSKGLKDLQSGVIRFAGAVTAATAVLAVTAYPIREAITYERALADIAKTTGFTSSQIDRLSSRLITLSTESSRSATELATIAAVAGQLGLGVTAGVEGVADFTETIGMAATALNVLEEEAAKMGATILNIFKFLPSETENILSVINELSNTSVARGEELADIIERIGTIAGLSFPQVAALAAYAKDLGVSTEVAGTSFVKMFTRMLSSADNFAELMQMSTQEWVSMVENDAVNALKAATQQISALGGAAQATAINQLFGQGRIYALTAKIVEDSANQFQLLDRHLHSSNTQMQEGTSIQEEFARVMETTQEQIRQTGNAFRALAIAAGDQSLDGLQDILADLRDWATRPETVEWALEFGRGLNSLIQQIREFTQFILDLGINWEAVGMAALYAAGAMLAIFTGKAAVYLVKHIADVGKIGTAWTTASAKLAAYNQQMQAQAAVAARTAGAAIGVVSGDSRTGRQRAEELQAATTEQERAANFQQRQLENQRLIVEARRQDLAAIKAAQTVAQRKLATLQQSQTATAQQVAHAQSHVQALQAQRAELARIVQSQAGRMGMMQRNVNNQAELIASYDATRQSVVGTNVAMQRQATITNRLGSAFARLGSGLALFAKTFVLPAVAMTAVFAGVGFALTKILEKMGLINNESRRLAREQRALERERQQELAQSLEQAEEWYERTQAMRSELTDPESLGAPDTQANAAAFRESITAMQGAARAAESYGNQIDELESRAERTRDEIASIAEEIEQLREAAASRPDLAPGLDSQADSLEREKQELQQQLDDIEDQVEHWAGRLSVSTEALTAGYLNLRNALSLLPDSYANAFTNALTRMGQLNAAMEENKARREDLLSELDADDDLDRQTSQQARLISELEVEYSELEDTLRKVRSGALAIADGTPALREFFRIFDDFSADDQLFFSEEALQGGAAAYQRMMDEMSSEEREMLEIRRQAVRYREQELEAQARIITAQQALRQARALGDGAAAQDAVSAAEQELETAKETANTRREIAAAWAQQNAEMADTATLDFFRELAEVDNAGLDAMRERSLMATNEVQTQRRRSAELLAQLAALDMQEQTLRVASAEFGHMAQSARSFADNIGSWATSFRRQTTSMVNGISEALANRNMEIEIDFKTDEINKELDEIEQKVEQQFRGMRMEALRRGDIAAVRRIDEQIEKEKERRRLEVEGRQIQEEYNRKLREAEGIQDSIAENIREMARLQQSSDPGDLLRATELRETIQDQFRSASDLRQELAQMRLPQMDAQDLGIASDQVVDEWKTGLRSLREEFRSTVTLGAEGMAENAEALFAPYRNSLEALQGAATAIRTELQELGVPQSLIDDLRSVREALDLSGFSSSIEGLIGDIEQSLRSGEGIDITRAMQVDANAFVGYLETAMANAADNANFSQIEDKLIEEFSKGEVDRKLAEQLEDVVVGLAPEDQAVVASRFNSFLDDISLEKIVTLTPQTSGSGTTPGFARGGSVGKVKGPGTATSDSILAALSKGEYVVDNWTTRFFGADFFKLLQQMARAGIGRTAFKGIIPGFNRGGPVVPQITMQNSPIMSSLAGTSTTQAARDVVDLNFKIGQESYRLSGARDQITGLVDSLKHVSRGSIK